MPGSAAKANEWIAADWDHIAVSDISVDHQLSIHVPPFQQHIEHVDVAVACDVEQHVQHCAVEVVEQAKIPFDAMSSLRLRISGLREQYLMEAVPLSSAVADDVEWERH